jgi:hypothetical protein
MTAKDFYWGSNSVAANQAMALIIANKIEPRTEYIEAATVFWIIFWKKSHRIL